MRPLKATPGGLSGAEPRDSSRGWALRPLIAPFTTPRGSKRPLTDPIFDPQETKTHSRRSLGSPISALHLQAAGRGRVLFLTASHEIRRLTISSIWQLQDCKACSKLGSSTYGVGSMSRDYAVPVSGVRQLLTVPPFRTQLHRPPLFYPTKIAEIGRATPCSCPYPSAILSLEQASRRTRDQEAFHHGHDSHSSILGPHRHSEARDITIVS